MALLTCLALAVCQNATFDDRSLSAQQRKAFKATLARLRRQDGEPGFGDPRPMWIKPYRVGPVRWLYLMSYPGYIHPSASRVRAYALDDRLRTTTKYEFPTGWRLWLEGGKLSQDKWFAQPVLTVEASAEMSLLPGGFNGQPPKGSTPADSTMLQTYVFTTSGARLIRLQTGSGKMLANMYGYGNHTVGPSTAGRTLKQWSNDLYSDEPIRQLSGMIWLAGRHLNSQQRRDSGIGSLESLHDSENFEALRASDPVRGRIGELSKSKNPWVREQAVFTLTRLSEPLEVINTFSFPKRRKP